jgi:hypothetical protein
MNTINLKCPHCGKQVNNVERAEWDPPQATLLVIPCECTQGCKIEGGDYYDKEGNEVDWFEWNKNKVGKEKKLIKTLKENKYDRK